MSDMLGKGERKIMRVELEHGGSEDYDVIHLDSKTLDKIVKWLNYRGERLINYPGEDGKWRILDVDTLSVQIGIDIPEDKQKMLEGFA